MNITSIIPFALLCMLCNHTQAFTPNNWRLSKLQRATSPRLKANFITFDLDDTIFPVGPVVNDANVALIHHLNTLGCASSQDDFLTTTKLIRTELAKEDKAITYTELRKRAIRIEMEKHLETNLISDNEVFGAYDLWEDHRHMAAERYLYSDTISMLREIKENHPDVIIAAITNGKGNPLKMNSIREYFDFCVSGEDDDVFPLRKPHEGIYTVALERFKELCEKRGKSIAIDEQCWIHVGDDLANDVGGSAKCGAYAVWVDLEDDYNQTASKRDANAKQPAWSTATKEELEKRKLMNEQAQKYISATVSTVLG